MSTRTLTAETSGPVLIDAALLGHGGVVTIRSEHGCDRARLTVHTADESGPAAEAVRAADLHQSGAVLYASVQGTSGSGGTTVITGGGRGSVIVQSAGTMVISGNVVAGDVVVNGQRIIAGRGVAVVPGGSGIAITAVVPERSSVRARTQSADLNVEGVIRTVTADSQSGDVRIAQATYTEVQTQSGDLRLTRAIEAVTAASMSGDIRIGDFTGTANLRTISGDIDLHASDGGDITASTMSGDITVTATDVALAAGLNIATRTMSGDVDVPRRRR